MPAGVTQKNSRQTANGRDSTRSNGKNSADEKPLTDLGESLTRKDSRLLRLCGQAHQRLGNSRNGGVIRARDDKSVLHALNGGGELR